VGALKTLLSRLRWEGRRFVSRFGASAALAACLGLMLIVASVAVFVAERNIEQLQSELSASSAQRRAAQIRPDDGGNGDLLRRLPPHGELPDQLKRIYMAAEREQVRLKIAEYRTKTEPDGSLVSVNISAIAADEYLRIQRALIEILNTVPNVGLESATFRRPDRRSTRVDARLSLVLYLRASEAARR